MLSTKGGFWRDRPYYKPVGNYPAGYAGFPAATADQVGDAINWAFENGIQILTHANGEAASDQLIAYVSAATEKHAAGDRRPVLIHGQFLREDQVDSFKALGIIPSLFPMHTYYWGDWHREHRRTSSQRQHLPHRLVPEARDEIHVTSRRAGRIP